MWAEETEQTDQDTSGGPQLGSIFKSTYDEPTFFSPPLFILQF